MNKAELINAAAEKAGLSKKDTEAAINAALDAIVESLPPKHLPATHSSPRWF